MAQTASPSERQLIFQHMFVGVLIYSVVLGFFNDYTDILHTTSYSVTFALAIVMQLLTYLTFQLKDVVVRWLGQRSGRWSKIVMGFGVWFVIFTSKFVFLAVISLVFSDDVHISGFVGILVVIVTMTLIQKLATVVYDRLK
jgi:L-asparagine transporter-like permease